MSNHDAEMVRDQWWWGRIRRLGYDYPTLADHLQALGLPRPSEGGSAYRREILVLIQSQPGMSIEAIGQRLLLARPTPVALPTTWTPPMEMLVAAVEAEPWLYAPRRRGGR